MKVLCFRGGALWCVVAVWLALGNRWMVCEDGKKTATSCHVAKLAEKCGNSVGYGTGFVIF